MTSPAEPSGSGRGWHLSRRAVGTALLLLSIAMLGAAGWLGAYPFYTNVRAERQQVNLSQQFSEIAKTTTEAE